MRITIITEILLYMRENKIDIKELFTSLQSQMQGVLATNSKFIVHPGSEGDSLEIAWIELLRNYLPNRYSVDKAMVIDNNGNVSQQIDIVIYDNWYTPFIFNQNGFKYIPADGVYAVFEVKPDIGEYSAGVHNIEYAGEKVASVRRLMRTSTHMINSGRKYDPRPLTKIIGGIIGIKCSQKDDTIESHIKNLKGLETLDLGCTVENGSFFVDYTSPAGEEEISSPNFDDYIKYYNDREFNLIKKSKPEHSLIMFLMQLTSYLQQSIGTVPAIDLQAYLRNIDETIDSEI